MRFLKSVDWFLVFLISLIVAIIALFVYFIWDQYHWRKLPDGRLYRLSYMCLSSHTETYPVVQTNIDPNGNVYTTTTLQTNTICDYEQVDTVWKETLTK
jgi:hypothetical protein